MSGIDFSELSPPYSTIVADPPWSYKEGWAPFGPTSHGGDQAARRPLPYSSLSVAQIAAMPVDDLAARDAHLYLWTTNRYLRESFDVAEAWGFKPTQTLVWCKPPMGIGPGGAFSITTEFVVFARRGTPGQRCRIDSTWWEWSRTQHSAKPDAFMDIVEQVSPGPYVELFCRRPRFGWDSWGKGYEISDPTPSGGSAPSSASSADGASSSEGGSVPAPSPAGTLPGTDERTQA